MPAMRPSLPHSLSLLQHQLLPLADIISHPRDACLPEFQVLLLQSYRMLPQQASDSSNPQGKVRLRTYTRLTRLLEAYNILKSLELVSYSKIFRVPPLHGTTTSALPRQESRALHSLLTWLFLAAISQEKGHLPSLLAWHLLLTASRAALKLKGYTPLSPLPKQKCVLCLSYARELLPRM